MRSASLNAAVCRDCAATSFPAVARCPACGSSEIDPEVTMPTTGQVLQATTMRVSLPQIEAPYVVCFVQLDNGVSLYCRMQGWDTSAESPTPGARIELAADETGAWWAEAR